jgi:hypothetical protein
MVAAVDSVTAMATLQHALPHEPQSKLPHNAGSGQAVATSTHAKSTVARNMVLWGLEKGPFARPFEETVKALHSL